MSISTVLPRIFTRGCCCCCCFYWVMLPLAATRNSDCVKIDGHYALTPKEIAARHSRNNLDDAHILYRLIPFLESPTGGIIVAITLCRKNIQFSNYVPPCLRFLEKKKINAIYRLNRSILALIETGCRFRSGIILRAVRKRVNS